MTDDAADGSSDGAAVARRAVLSADVSARDWTRTRTSDATAPPPRADVAAVEAAQAEAAEPPPADAPPADAPPADAPPADAPPADAPSADPPSADPPPAEPAEAQPTTVGSPAGELPLLDPVGRDSDVTVGLSADSAGGEPAPEPAAPDATEPTAPARRPPLVVQGLASALAAGVLAGAAAWGTLPLAAAVLVLQVGLALGVLALLDAPSTGGSLVVGLGAGVAADALVLGDDGQVDRLAGVVGLALVVSLLHQLVRRGRSRVTESLADTLVVVVVVVSAACLVALHLLAGGEHLLLVGLAAAAAVLFVGRVVDRLLARPALAVGATRGWPGLLLALAAGVVTAVLVAPLGDGELPPGSAALLGLLVAATVATADLAVDLGAAELRADWRDVRRVAAVRPTALLLPYALLGPVVLLAGRLVLG